MTSDSPEAKALLETATLAFASHRAETTTLITRALEADGGLVAGHCLRGLLLRLLGRRDLREEIAKALSRAESSLSIRGGSPREHALTTALRAWFEGDPLRAAAVLETCLDTCPSDLLLLKLSYAIRFMTGDLEGMTRAVARMCARLDGSSVAYGYALGMRAFVLEEAGEYRDAERVGYEALARAPDDVWGAHAILHVHAVQDRPELGLAFLTTRTGMLDGLNNFAAHVEWHRALFHIALGELDAALALYDTRISTVPARDYRDMVNATSLLVRLEREGMDVADRWQRLADIASTRTGDHGLAFADVHYVLALVSAGRSGDADAFLASIRAHLETIDDHDARVARDVGLPLAEAIRSSARSFDHARSDVRLIDTSLQRLGGSNLQRSLFTLARANR